MPHPFDDADLPEIWAMLDEYRQPAVNLAVKETSDFDDFVETARKLLRLRNPQVFGVINFQGRRVSSEVHEFPITTDGEVIAALQVRIVGDAVVVDYFWAGELEPAIRVTELPDRLKN